MILWLIAIPIILIFMYLVFIWGRYLLQEIHHEFMKAKRAIKQFLLYHGW